MMSYFRLLFAYFLANVCMRTLCMYVCFLIFLLFSQMGWMLCDVLVCRAAATPVCRVLKELLTMRKFYWYCIFPFMSRVFILRIPTEEILIPRMTNRVEEERRGWRGYVRVAYRWRLEVLHVYSSVRQTNTNGSMTRAQTWLAIYFLLDVRDEEINLLQIQSKILFVFGNFCLFLSIEKKRSKSNSKWMNTLQRHRRWLLLRAIVQLRLLRVKLKIIYNAFRIVTVLHPFSSSLLHSPLFQRCSNTLDL